MRRSLLLVWLALCPWVAFAAPSSLGATVGWAPSGVTLKESLDGDWIKSHQSFPNALEGQVYFDTNYLLFSLGYVGNDPYYLKELSDSSGYDDSTAAYNGLCGGWLTYGLAVKYPFVFRRFSLFPVLGVEFDQNLSYTDAGGNDLREGMTTEAKNDLDQLWFRLGGGMDLPLGKVVYLRLAVVGAFKLQNHSEQDTVKAEEQAYGVKADLLTTRVSTQLSLGFRLPK